MAIICRKQQTTYEFQLHFTALGLSFSRQVEHFKSNNEWKKKGVSVCFSHEANSWLSQVGAPLSVREMELAPRS